MRKKIVAFRGATMYEMQIGRVIIQLVRWMYWNTRNWPFLRVRTTPYR